MRRIFIPISIAAALLAVALFVDHDQRRPPPPDPRTSAPPTAAVDPKIREAGDRGLAYLSRASRAWTEQHRCFGCHVQSVTMEALSVGHRHRFDVASADLDAMVSALELGVTAGGRVTGAAFQGAAWARYDRWVSGEKTARLLEWAEQLVKLQDPSGAVIDDDARKPITGGTMQTTFQAAQTWRQAHERTADDKWLVPLRRAEAYLSKVQAAWPGSGEGVDIQDINFALMGLFESGVGPAEPASIRLKQMLHARQNDDGGFGLERASDAFATGQTAYALTVAGHADARVHRALGYLLEHQDPSGAWRTVGGGQGGADKGETMWAVLGLVTTDVARIELEGLVDGQHLSRLTRVFAQAKTQAEGQVFSVKLFVDDQMMNGAWGGDLDLAIDPKALSAGKHVFEVVAETSKGQARRRIEFYTGDVFMTHVAADFDEAQRKTIVALRGIQALAGAIGLEIWRLGEDGEAVARVHAEEKAAALGPIHFDWAGEASVSGPTRYEARLVRKDDKGVARQTEKVIFVHDTEEAQRARYAEVEGKLSLDKGGHAASNTVVELVDAVGNVVQRTRTTAQGNYRFKNVSQGGYTVRTQKDGFSSLEQRVEARANSAPAKAEMSW